MNLDADIALAHRLADAAGAVIRPHFRTDLDTQRKGDASPVTEADRGAEEAMRRLLKAEAVGRNMRKQNMLTRLAGFPAIKTLDDFDYEFAQGVKRSQIEELAGLGFVERKSTYSC